ncbi:MAG: extracellular solute-binding protein [Zoogloeaceae bacterium]|jgi:sn-glycerol 3-phosphate transport system substrate-binding protein|nr:extracellular solute-binding protein [Zoogloeaceae bacterium]
MPIFFSRRARSAFFVLLLCGFCAAELPAEAAQAKKPARKETKAAVAPGGEAANEIEFAHALSSANAMRLAALVERFNQQNSSAPDAMRIRLIQEAPGRKKPEPLNLATPGTIASFLANKTAFKPVHQLLREEGFALPSGGLSANLTSESGRALPMALPLAFSTPVLFYNKRLFRQAGLDADAPPATWQEMQRVSDALMDRGVLCPYTSSWPVWVHIDNQSAISGAPIASAKGVFSFNGLFQVKHIALLASWHKAAYFQNFGRANEADSHFYSGECAMITTNADAQTYFADAPGMELGAAPLPFHNDLPGGARHTLAAGASLWVGQGYKPKTYRNIARFLAFLLAPDTQIEISRTGGFLPLTPSALDAVRGTLLKDEEQTLNTAISSLKGRGAALPLRVSLLDPIRIIADEELEQVWAGKKPAKAALDTAVKRGNAVLSAKPALRRAIMP